MYIISSKSMLEKAQSEGHAVSVFNIHNLETSQVVAESVVQLRFPVMLAGIPGTYRYGGVGSLISLVQSLAREYNLPLVLHLDHHEESDDIFNKVRVGIRPVMINGSHSPFKDNIVRVQEVTILCHCLDASVEAELGRLGGQGDNLWVDEKDSTYTSPATAVEFVQRTQVNSLAVTIGAAYSLHAHGPQLDFVWLEQIRQRVEILLMLHGALGLLEQDVQHCIRRGICRVNVATELKIASVDALKGYFYNNPAVNDPRHYMQSAEAAMKEAIIRTIGVCSSEGKI